MPYLMELSIFNNPLQRKVNNYRNAVIKRLQSLIILDGKEITQEERLKIEQ